MAKYGSYENMMDNALELVRVAEVQKAVCRANGRFISATASINFHPDTMHEWKRLMARAIARNLGRDDYWIQRVLVSNHDVNGRALFVTYITYRKLEDNTLNKVILFDPSER